MIEPLWHFEPSWRVLPGMEAWQVSRRMYAVKAPDDESLIERMGQ